MAVTAMNMVKQGGSDPRGAAGKPKAPFGAPRFNTQTRSGEGPAEKALLRTRILDFIQWFCLE